MKHISSKKSPFGGFRGPALFFALLLFFSSCSEEEGGGYEPLGDDSSLMRVDIRKGGSSPTYAETEEPAFNQEKEMESIAFFTQCGNTGTPGQPGFRTGAFHKFFSTEELRSPNGLYEPFDETTGGYTTTIRIKSDAFGGPTKVIVIANYASNGLTDALMAVEKWEDLEKIRTNALTNSNLQTPLLMYAYDDQVNLTAGNTVPVTFKLQRVVSRIDVVNRAFDATDPSKGFVLERAQLLAPRAYSFLMPGNAKRHDIPTITSLPMILSANAPAYDEKQVTGMYLYETDNQNATIGKTQVKVEGKLFNRPFSRIVDLKYPDTTYTKPGGPIAMQRNHLYRLIINPLISEEVEVDIDIVDWSDGTSLSVKPTPQVPVLSNVTASNNGSSTQWVANTKTLTYDGAQKETITFTTTGPQPSRIDYSCTLDPTGMSLGLHNAGTPEYKELIQAGKPVVSYAIVTQNFTLTLPAVKTDHTVPVDMKFYIRNEANPYFADSITIKCRPNYLDSPYKPVLLGGLYWAPLNVGATDIMGSTTPKTANTGYYFQWGRNTPFDAETDYSNTMVSANNTNYRQATDGVDKDFFINGTTADNSNNDWIKTTDPNHALRNKQWSKAVNNSPCPKGWRVPTKAELEYIRTGTQTELKAENRTRVNGSESGQYLYLPLAGFRNLTTSAVSSYGGQFRLWSSEVATSELSWSIYNKTAQEFNRAYALPIRCVQDTEYGVL
ncbi:fibrobacter succinogenes major paralogous domain-containing protein [Parabacteroides sp. OttesenSCG-928-K15]|nr:fibrobacter succinogenes major paralogous domain-containing protein [Parabacteroides sp. OttesenSCG-928-K15]